MNRKTIWSFGSIVGLLITAGCQPSKGGSAGEEMVSARLAADYVHTVIAADRAVYATQVVQRLQDEEKVIQASEHFKEDKALPLPAQMLRMGAQRASAGGGLRYALISKWAINKTNLPRTDFERRGIEAIVARPEEVFTAYDTVGGVRYFMAMYPDLAVSPACVDCHNKHAESPRQDFREGDVMGGLVISMPLAE